MDDVMLPDPTEFEKSPPHRITWEQVCSLASKASIFTSFSLPRFGEIIREHTALVADVCAAERVSDWDRSLTLAVRADFLAFEVESATAMLTDGGRTFATEIVFMPTREIVRALDHLCEIEIAGDAA